MTKIELTAEFKQIAKAIYSDYQWSKGNAGESPNKDAAVYLCDYLECRGVPSEYQASIVDHLVDLCLDSEYVEDFTTKLYAACVLAGYGIDFNK